LEDVRQNAVSAAVHDTRFRPVTTEELGALSYSISVLDLPRALQGVSPADLPAYMQKHRPGVIIEYRGRRSTFLPSVWEDLPDALGFLSRLCMKQGSPADCWKEADARISTYGSIHFSET
jgi:AmmeMemoRadiSam system protein A